jgi:hypothetical protein
MHLPKNTLPSALLLVIRLVESGCSEDIISAESHELVTLKQMLKVTDILKMRTLEKHLLVSIILP